MSYDIRHPSNATRPQPRHERRRIERRRHGFASLALIVVTLLVLPPIATRASASCGDGAIDVGESCDDQNASGGDGCSEACQTEPCWTCTGEPSFCTPDDGAPCDDGAYCNGADACVGGTCSVHAGDPCPGADGDASCSESCHEPTDACTAPDPDGSACNDGLFCSGVDFCAGGACSAHTGDPCPGPDGDGNCSEGCNEPADACTAPDPNGSACDDGLFCTGNDTCGAGSCSAHGGDPCAGPDGDANCSESCDEASDACSAADPNGSACTDGVFCNGADACDGGTCSVHPGDPCPGADGDADCSESCHETADTCTAPDPNGAVCDDGAFCTGLDFCAGGTCSAHTNDPCPGPDGDADCGESCDEDADACTGADPNGAFCDDGYFCTGADRCAAGTCSDHPSPPCAGPDGDADCAESCNEGSQSCSEPDPDGAACNDGLYCTVDDGCQSGSCGGTPRDCNAVGDQCNDGVCDEDGDACIGPPKPAGTPCDDASACTVPDTCDGGGMCTGVPDTVSCLDHFTCYKASRSSGTAKFVPVTNVTLTDQFSTSTVTVTKPRLLCAPTDADGVAPDAPDHADHLEDHQIKAAFAFAGAGPRTITNQFGSVVVQVLKRNGLFLPTRASLVAPPGPLAAPAVDHFQCYAVKIASGQPRFERFQLPVTDRFGLRLVTVMKPRRLCAPVDTNGTAPGAEVHPQHLLCYQVKEYSYPKFAKVSSIFTHPDFGPQTLDAKTPVELCVPSLKLP